MIPCFPLIIEESSLCVQIDWLCVFYCADYVYNAPCSPPLHLSLASVWSNTFCPINPLLSIPTAITACPKLPESLIRGEFTSSHCKTAGSAMGPYFLFITANWRWADSRKSFSGMIDQQRAICLSFLIGGVNVALCLLKSPLETETARIGRVQEFVQRWGHRDSDLANLLWLSGSLDTFPFITATARDCSKC